MPFTISLKDIWRKETYVVEKTWKYIKDQLPESLRNINRKELRITVAAIAGRDSSATILEAAQSGDWDCILPVLIGAPPESLSRFDLNPTQTPLGGFEVRLNTIKDLKHAIESGVKSGKPRCHLLNIVYISGGAHAWQELYKWTQNNWHFSTGDDFLNSALMTPCIPCHVYIHYLRAAVCRALGIDKMISGDRILHDKRVKVNQFDFVIDTIIDIVKKEFGVDFVTPMRNQQDTSKIQRLLVESGIGSINDVECVFSGRGIVTDQTASNVSDEVSVSISETIKGGIVEILRNALNSLYHKI